MNIIAIIGAIHPLSFPMKNLVMTLKRAPFVVKSLILKLLLIIKSGIKGGKK
jgi:hypothetical protein